MNPRRKHQTSFLNTIQMGLGAWAFGDRFVWNFGTDYNAKDIESAFTISIDAGINFVDTAEVYAQGKSERFIGQFIKKTDTQVFIASKFFPYPWRINKKSVIRALQNSLERLDVNRIDLYQIHWPPATMSIEAVSEALVEVANTELTAAVGVSNFNREQMDKVLSVLTKNNIPLASNQVQYSLLDRRIEKNGLMDQCKESNIRVIAYSPLAKGLLTGKYSADRPPRGVRGRQFSKLLGKIEPMVKALNEIGLVYKKTPGQIALNWVIQKGALPIPGAKNAEQASQNAGALGWKLSQAQMDALDLISDQITED